VGRRDQQLDDEGARRHVIPGRAVDRKQRGHQRSAVLRDGAGQQVEQAVLTGVGGGDVRMRLRQRRRGDAGRVGRPVQAAQGCDVVDP